MLEYFCSTIQSYAVMDKKTKNQTKIKKRKSSDDKESIAALKEKIKHQKDALNKIIKTYSK